MGLFQSFRTYLALKKDLEENRLDFSGIDTLKKATELARQGELVKIDLIPPRLGGKASPENQVFVPRFAANDKKRYDDMAEELLRESKADSYSCTAVHKSGSQVPAMLNIDVTRNGESVLSAGVNIW